MVSFDAQVRVRGDIDLVDGACVVRDGLRAFKLEGGVPETELKRILQELNASRTYAEFLSGVADIDLPWVSEFVSELDAALLIEERGSAEYHTGLDALFQIEDLANDLIETSISRNDFWRNIAQSDRSVPINVMYGQVIENYHFLFRESYFDSPVLCFQGSTKARLMMNEFYAEELGHDELLLQSLGTLGISREDLFDTMPLPQTMALCNALAYWSTFDPIFFFSTLGVLEGKDLTQIDSFTEACERMGLDSGFVGPVKKHANINLKGEHGNLTRKIFAEIDVIDTQTLRRLLSQTRLFIELYDQYYTSVWNHYSTTKQLLRRTSSLL